MESMPLEVADYPVKLEDIDKNLLSRAYMFDLLMSGASLHLSQVSNQDFASLFKTETLKIFTDFVFLDLDEKPNSPPQPKLYIIIKTWQKIKF